MKSSILEQNRHATNAHAPLDRRYAERVPIHYRVFYTGRRALDSLKHKDPLLTCQKPAAKSSGRCSQLQEAVLPSPCI